MATDPNEQKKQAHMQRRRGHGLTFKDLGNEFGTSKSTAHRKAGDGMDGKQQKPKAPKTEKVKTDRGTFTIK